MFTEEFKQRLVGKVLKILRDNHINRNEIRALFGADIPGVSGENIDSAAEMISGLFIKERLSIEEGKNVLRVVMDNIAGEIDSPLPG